MKNNTKYKECLTSNKENHTDPKLPVAAPTRDVNSDTALPETKARAQRLTKTSNVDIADIKMPKLAITHKTLKVLTQLQP